MEITKKSILTGNENTMDIPLTPEEYIKGHLKRVKEGALIQDVFPQLSMWQREFNTNKD